MVAAAVAAVTVAGRRPAPSVAVFRSPLSSLATLLEMQKELEWQKWKRRQKSLECENL